MLQVKLADIQIRLNKRQIRSIVKTATTFQRIQNFHIGFAILNIFSVFSQMMMIEVIGES